MPTQGAKQPMRTQGAKQQTRTQGAKQATALITGASGGLGAAIAEALAPTHTLLLAGRASNRLDDVAQRVGATALPLDLTEIDVLSAAADMVGELDVLVHNAGVAFPDRLADSRIHDWRTSFDVNVIGAVALTLALLPSLRRAKGQVVFVNSGAGLNVLDGMASYSASKFALRAFADSLRVEEASLRVTSVHPGRIATTMQRKLRQFERGKYDPKDYLRPETVAHAIADIIATPPDGHVHEVVIRQR
jgi:NADP-dependent 3-hydroxy acid dehydrogenase YdfG